MLVLPDGIEEFPRPPVFGNYLYSVLYRKKTDADKQK